MSYQQFFLDHFSLFDRFLNSFGLSFGEKGLANTPNKLKINFQFTIELEYILSQLYYCLDFHYK
jgi:hypothetical protein